MISKSKQKLIRALAQKKQRDALGLFVAEGRKAVHDLLPHFACRYLAATADFLEAHPGLRADEVDCIGPDDLERLSLQRAPQQVVAVMAKPAAASAEACAALPASELCLALDGVQDPGNVGTIVRVADWFGIRHIFCSPDTADAFGCKTVQATMGSLGRVALHYGPLVPLLEALPEGVPVFGTFLDGDAPESAGTPACGVVVMGSEGRGISPEVGRLVTRRLFIARHPADNLHPESLNVGVATALVCHALRRPSHR